MIDIRPEIPGDDSEIAGVRAVNTAAFGRPDEAELVDRLRAEGCALLSLVAAEAGAIVGHILFTRMWIETDSGRVPAVSLAPVAVLPSRQKEGIGGRLIVRGLECLRDRGERIALVLGHPGYYPKFGFSVERTRLLRSPFPPEAFMGLELAPGSLDGVQGSVVYPPPFGLAAL